MERTLVILTEGDVEDVAEVTTEEEDIKEKLQDVAKAYVKT